MKRKIFVFAKTKARKESVEKISETHFTVAVKEMPAKGKANKAIIKAIAGFFGVAPSRARVISGQKSKRKTIEIY